MRIVTVLSGLLAVAPAASIEGTYTGQAEFLEGDRTLCTKEVILLMTLTVNGSSAHATVLSAVERRTQRVSYANGDLSPDGSLKLAWAWAPDFYTEGKTQWEGSFADGRVSGVSRSNVCRYKWALIKR